MVYGWKHAYNATGAPLARAWPSSPLKTANAALRALKRLLRSNLGGCGVNYTKIEDLEHVS